MNERKNLLIVLGEWWEQRRADSLATAPEGPPNHVRRLLRWLTPNGGTLLLIIILVLTQNVWARPATSPAAAPGPSATTVNYQGRLADSGGAPLDGSYGMSFALYDALTAGSMVWGPENHTAVPVSDGLFSVGLGSQTGGGIPTSVWDGDRYLEITVGGETLSPRELIRSVPIAGMALTVPDGAVKSRSMSPTFFETSAGSEIAVTTSSSSNNFVAFSLTVDFPIDANYVIFYKIISRHGEANRRVLTTLRDENFDAIGLASGIINCHPRGGVEGSQTGFATATHFFTAGTHTINVIAWADYPTNTYIRTTSSITAIPFAVNP
jgi:hypothetical protein